MSRFRPVSFEDRLTMVDHLDELRTRIVVSISAFAFAFTLCFWQNSRLLDIANAPLPGDRTPITFGVAEPFTTTVTVSAYAAIVISLPVILYQAYAYLLPALTDRERRVILPFLTMVPLLFCAGAVFGYFVVLPAATKFLLNFNQSQFNIQIRAKDYYSFFTMTLGVMGLIFQLPIGILAVTRLGIVTPKQLARNRRYAYLVIAVVAAALPGTDPVSMLLEMVPLIVLFEASLVLARVAGTPAHVNPETELATAEST
ncbi:MAG TPA: twin-arginine translocase subunit TatC [Solirubrobacterales bacterium]